MESSVPGIWGWFSGRANLALSAAPWDQLTSWWRDPARNRAVGGHERSQHLLGLAIDVTGDLPALARAFEQVGFVAILESDHVHIQAYRSGVLPDWIYRRAV